MTGAVDLFDVSRFITAEETRKGSANPESVASSFVEQDIGILKETTSDTKTVASLATVQECRNGLGHLVRLATPAFRGAGWWGRLLADAQSFERIWLEEAVALGWTTKQMFGCNREPWAGRLDLNGLVISLSGRAVRSLTATYAEISQRHGGASKFFLHAPGCSVPFNFAASVPIWEAFSA